MNDTQRIIEKAKQGLRISLKEALQLVKAASIHELGRLAYQIRTKLYADQAFMSIINILIIPISVRMRAASVHTVKGQARTEHTPIP